MDTATVEVAVTNLTFEQYRDVMMKWVHRIVPRRVRKSPFEEREDLYAEADYALWQVYSKYSSKKPTDDLCRIGTRAVICRMLDVWKMTGSGRSRGWESPTGDLTVDGPRGRRRVVRIVKPRLSSLDRVGLTGRASDVPVASSQAEKLDLRAAVERAAALADEMYPGSAAVLSEALNPGADTLDSYERGSGCSDAVADGLGQEKVHVKRAFDVLRAVLFEDEPTKLKEVAMAIEAPDKVSTEAVPKQPKTVEPRKLKVGDAVRYVGKKCPGLLDAELIVVGMEIHVQHKVTGKKTWISDRQVERVEVAG